MAKKISPYKAAKNYMGKARKQLKKAGEKNGAYKDVEMVQEASDKACDAVCFALNEYLRQNEKGKFKKPKGIKQYRKRLAKYDPKILRQLNVVYDALHLVGYSYGTTSKKIIETGMKDAEKLIKLIK